METKVTLCDYPQDFASVVGHYDRTDPLPVHQASGVDKLVCGTQCDRRCRHGLPNHYGVERSGALVAAKKPNQISPSDDSLKFTRPTNDDKSSELRFTQKFLGLMERRV